MYERSLLASVCTALEDTPIVLLTGARQTGKTTLARQLAATRPGTRFLSLDDAAVLAGAHMDPQGLVTGWDGLTILDEVQRAPGLFPAIKLAVDRNRRPGAFLLTGSADVPLSPRISESLAGRMEIHTLWPLSVGETLGVAEGFVDALFGPELPPLPPGPAQAVPLARCVLAGGYPEAMARKDPARRGEWFRSYVATVVEREVRELAAIHRLAELPRLLEVLALRTSSLLNVAELSRTLGLPYASLHSYLALLRAAYLFAPLPSWSAHLGKRLVKAPKVHLCDSGLAAFLVRTGAEEWEDGAALVGPLVESFVVMELRKQSALAKARPALYHFRTGAGDEVDILLEGPGRKVVGIEVKAGATLDTSSFAGLRRLSESLGDRFHRGVVLYGGDAVLPFGPRTHAMPVSALWRLGAHSARRNPR